ncbi:uncharacterized protein LOC107368401 [Tetranychus urticae]|uniref:Apple domain-containing protein n=1 Tax=Tetranychus urticae TaxID=32264 RepID=T1KY75_TETUR|nr:uncharacterized protein LOC107368401 [Tetranychus urticae]
MISSVTLYLLLFLTFSQLNQADDDLCKFNGTQGIKVTSPLLNKQSGYSTIVEIVSPDSSVIQIKDEYNGDTKTGSIVFETREPVKSIHYYWTSKELFVINNGSTMCETLPLDSVHKNAVMSEWMTPEMDQYLDRLGSAVDNVDQLGPTLMMTIVSALSISAYYQGKKTLDDFSVKHWSACASPADSDLAIDFYFLAKTNTPYRLEIYHQKNANSKTLLNFLTFNQIPAKHDQHVTFPLGFGCKRLNKPKVAIPSWASGDTYFLEMEAALSFVKPDRFTLSSAKVIKYQNVYSYEITESNSITRSIKTPTLINFYQVDPVTGKCSIEYRPFYDFTAKLLTTLWPVSTPSTYNLLSPSLYNLDYTNYLGQVDTEYGTMDVFEGVIFAFYSTTQNEQIDALIQYYFPTFNAVDNRNQPPHHIIIKPYNLNNYGWLTASIPNQIEITVVDYMENDINYNDYFDISGCYDEPGQYTWFQLVFPDTSLDIARYQEKDLSIYKSFEAMVSNLIPKLRLPEIRVNIFGPNIYVTGKLLEAETHNVISTQSTVLSNPTRIVIREYLEDCSQLCLDADHCPAFAHCNNLECYLFTPKDEAYEQEASDNCTLYFPLYSDSSSTTPLVELNLLKSTKNILHQLKDKMTRGELVLPNLKLSAADLFIVNGPEEIGGLDEEYKDRSSPSAYSGDDFVVIQPNRRFTSEPTRTLGVSYQSCLSLCSNNDDCLTISYCPAPLSECTMTNKTASVVEQSYQRFSSYVDGCHILSKSFISFYRKLPGRSLVIDAVSQVKNVKDTECAQLCTQSTAFDCKSFDYCPKIKNTQDSKEESACFLHTLHVATDTAHEIKRDVWDFSTSECDHYSRKLSKDYRHLIGQKLSEELQFIETVDDVSLEHCASRCSSGSVRCTTFEYCEAPDSVSNSLSTCRLTKSNPVNSNYLVQSSSKTNLCSVYVSKKARKGGKGDLDDQDEGGLGMAMAMGATFFISAFVIGIIASHLYIKKSS